MNNIFTKFFNFKKKLNQKEILFQNIKNTSDVKSIFNAISGHNEWSDVRYVGGCVRKILNNENYDDIDLATNLNPDQVKECLTLNKIEFFETGIKHGTITARIGNQNFEITSLRNDVKRVGISLFSPCEEIENINEYDIPLTHCITPKKIYTFSRVL